MVAASRARLPGESRLCMYGEPPLSWEKPGGGRSNPVAASAATPVEAVSAAKASAPWITDRIQNDPSLGSEKLAWTFRMPVMMFALYMPQANALLAIGAPWFGELNVSSPLTGRILLHSRATMPPLL